MAKQRNSSIPVPATAEQAVQTFNEKVHRYDTLEATIDKVVSKYNADQAALTEKRNALLKPYVEEQERLKAEINTEALANRKTIFGDAKKMKIGRVWLIFQEGKPALCLEKDYKDKKQETSAWKAVVDGLEKIGAKAKKYLRVKTELDKDAIKKALADPKEKKLFDGLGLVVKTKEDFNIEVEKEKVK